MSSDWTQLTPEQQTAVLEVMRRKAAVLGVALAGEVTISADGEELVVPAAEL